VYTNSHYRPIPLGLSLFERLQQAFGKKNIATIMLTGKPMGLGPGGPRRLAEPGLNESSSIGGHGKERSQLESIHLKQEHNVAGQPFYLTKSALTRWDGDSTRDASRVGPKALAAIDKYASGRFFLFIHFGDADVAGHTYGENSRAYDEALATLDQWLGRIMLKLKSTKADDRTVVYVTSDHGFDVGTTHHYHATHIFLAGNDPYLVQHGEQRDVTPTVLHALGVDTNTITPPLQGKSLRREP